MVVLHRIDSVSDKWYEEFYTIYSQSFPVYEQRDEKQQECAFNNTNYHLDCFIDDHKFLAFIAYWDFDNYIYIEHFAVNPEYRGENIGSNTLRNFIEDKKKMILLEIDPPVNEIAQKRLKFYEKLGFVSNPYSHHHPAYKKDYPPHELIVLSMDKALEQSSYDRFYQELSHIVMKQN